MQPILVIWWDNVRYLISRHLKHLHAVLLPDLAGSLKEEYQATCSTCISFNSLLIYMKQIAISSHFEGGFDEHSNILICSGINMNVPPVLD